jgi:inhibitor of KinA
MTELHPLQWSPLGEAAWLVYFPSEDAAIRFAQRVREANFPWLFDLVPAYASVGLFFDSERNSASEVRATIEAIPIIAESTMLAGKLHLLPCCYEMQLDLDRVRERTGLDFETIISLHTSIEYRVYAVGFCPGFPYLGYLPPELQGVPRLPSPRVRVEPGSVGLTGKQTGLYPLVRPGGWNVIGRTPLKIVDFAEGYFPIRVGDRVRFARIDESEFHRREGERL